MNILVLSAISKAASILLAGVSAAADSGDLDAANDLYRRACAAMEPVTAVHKASAPPQHVPTPAPVVHKAAPKKPAPRKTASKGPVKPISHVVPIPSVRTAKPTPTTQAPAEPDTFQETDPVEDFGVVPPVFDDNENPDTEDAALFDPEAFGSETQEDDEEPLDPPEGTTWNGKVRQNGAWIDIANFPGAPNEYDSESQTYLSARSGQWETLPEMYRPTLQIGAKRLQRSGGCLWETHGNRHCWCVAGDTLATLASKGFPG